MNGAMGMFADTVLMMPSMVPVAAFISSSFLLTMNASAPSRSRASCFFPGDELITVTFIPNALANFTATWPSPPRPSTPTCFPGVFSPWYFMGLYTVMPAQSSGAPWSRGIASGNRTTNRSCTTTLLE
uniref:Uncharacterized protein n=1 Tax=Arundo donax TaxID=35708 RepID=A0A0A9CXH3_ARUDO